MFSGLPPKADLGRDPAATVLAIEVLQLAVRQRRIELAVRDAPRCPWRARALSAAVVDSAVGLAIAPSRLSGHL